jgi:hypothetical protein
MNRFSLLVLVVLVSLASYEALGTTYAPKPIEEIFKKTVAIKVVRVVEGRLIRVDYQQKREDCGSVYVGEVEDNLLGDGEAVEFMAERPLRIGMKYVVFLTEGDTAGHDMMSTNSMMWPAIKKEMEIRELCESGYSGLKAIRGLTSEFKSSRSVKSGDDWIGEPWVEASQLAFPSHSVAVYEFEAETIKVYAPEKDVVTLSADELLDDSTQPDGSAYPFVWLNEILMDWAGYRAAIIYELAKFEASTGDSGGGSE